MAPIAACRPKNTNRAPAPPPAYVGPLDAYEGSVIAAVGVARLLSSWEGALLRVRSGGGGTEQDIGYAENGTLDLVALAGFLGGLPGTVVKFYDQTGGGNHLGNTNTSQQPTLSTNVTAFGATPAATFDGGDDALTFEGVISSPAAILTGAWSSSSSGLGRYVSHVDGFSSLFELGTNSAHGRFGSETGQLSTVFANPNSAHGMELWYNGASSIIRIDTAEEASAADTPLDSGLYRVGALDTGFQSMIGSIAYVVMLSSFLPAPDRAAIRTGLATLIPTAA